MGLRIIEIRQFSIHTEVRLITQMCLHPLIQKLQTVAFLKHTVIQNIITHTLLQYEKCMYRVCIR